MRFILALITAAISLNAYAGCKKPLVVAVIDTGFGMTAESRKAKLCKYGHKDFTSDQIYAKGFNTVSKVPMDTWGHGTNVVGVIAKQLEKSGVNYCFVIVKAFSEKETEGARFQSSIYAFMYLKNLKPDIINYSGGGSSGDAREREAILSLLDNGTKVIAAAGNESNDLDNPGNHFYPAQYDPRIVMVGNVDSQGNRAPMTNYGSVVTRVEVGQDVEGFGIKLSGTSQATAVATGKITSTLNKRCDR